MELSSRTAERPSRHSASTFGPSASAAAESALPLSLENSSRRESQSLTGRTAGTAISHSQAYCRRSYSASPLQSPPGAKPSIAERTSPA